MYILPYINIRYVIAIILYVNQFPFRDVYFFISILYPEQPCGSCRPEVILLWCFLIN